VTRRHRLDAFARIVLAYLETWGRSTHLFWGSMTDAVREIDLPRSTIYEALGVLVETGAVVCLGAFPGTRQNLYRLQWLALDEPLQGRPGEEFERLTFLTPPQLAALMAARAPAPDAGEKRSAPVSATRTLAGGESPAGGRSPSTVRTRTLDMNLETEGREKTAPPLLSGAVAQRPTTPEKDTAPATPTSTPPRDAPALQVLAADDAQLLEIAYPHGEDGRPRTWTLNAIAEARRNGASQADLLQALQNPRGLTPWQAVRAAGEAAAARMKTDRAAKAGRPVVPATPADPSVALRTAAAIAEIQAKGHTHARSPDLGCLVIDSVAGGRILLRIQSRALKGGPVTIPDPAGWTFGGAELLAGAADVALEGERA